MKWFKHISDSGHDKDIGELLSLFGSDGYYLFFRTIEIMSREFSVENPGKISINFHFFLSEFRKISKNKLLKFLEITNRRRRIYYKIEGDIIHLNCPKLKELCDEYTDKMIKRMSGEDREKIGRKSGQVSGVTPEPRARVRSQKQREKKKQIKKKEQDKDSKKKGVNVDKSSIIEKWREFAEKYSLAIIESISGEREKHLRARISSEDFFDFDELLSLIEKQPFLLGKNKSGWRITFDWIINLSNYTKITEKTYVDRKASESFETSSRESPDEWEKRRARERTEKKNAD